MSEILNYSSGASSSSALMLNSSDDHVNQAAQYLREGKLVAFPTETVYGLGANAFDEKAVRSIFTAKGRPLTDPLIVHIPHLSAAKKLANISAEEMVLFDLLGSTLWPGPLTMIVKAVDVLPLCVTANTGFVGLRVPDHPLALRILEACQLPICAPSANRFGHVSPTKATHVYADLGVGRNVAAIISGDVEAEGGACLHGIESTVVKANIANKEVQIYRQGAVSQTRLQEILENVENVKKLGGVQWTVRVVSRIVHMTASDLVPTPTCTGANTSIKTDTDTTTTTTVGQEAPGQAVTHYAPDNGVCVMSTVVDVSNKSDCATSSVGGGVDHADGLVDWEITAEELKSAVVIDFGGQWKRLLQRQPVLNVLAYRDLSPSGSYAEAAHALFDTLRWAEAVPAVRLIILTPVLQPMRTIEDKMDSSSDSNCDSNSNSDGDALKLLQADTRASDVDIKLGLYDRQFRATSGKLVYMRFT